MRRPALITATKAALHSGSAQAFGSTMTVWVRHRDRALAQKAIADALRQVEIVEHLIQSQVWTLNRDGVLEHPDAHLLEVVRQAGKLSQLTRGAFDITVQPLWCLFGGGNCLPSEEQVHSARAHVGWRRVRADSRQVRLQKPGTAITLDGLALGYVADLALAAVRRHGVLEVVVDAGEAVSAMQGRCAATAGNADSAFTADFMDQHVVDPAAGLAPRELASVTVLAPSATLADGLSTAFMVMGARKAHALAARQPGVEVMTVNRRGVVWKSPTYSAFT